MTTRPRAKRIKPKAGYHHGDLRRQLVAAARRLIDKQGHDVFRLADAAALAGVSAAAPYRHFKDRDALLMAAAEDGFDRLAAQATEAAGEWPGGSVEAICAIGKAYIGFAADNPYLFRLMFGPDSGTRTHKADGAGPQGAAAYQVLIRHVATNLQLAPQAPPVLGTALSLWMYVHGFASLLIDDKLGVGQLDIDIDRMLIANTRHMLGAFLSDAAR